MTIKFCQFNIYSHETNKLTTLVDCFELLILDAGAIPASSTA